MPQPDPGDVDAAQARYLDRTSLAHRQAYGQFFTPAPVARMMAAWVLAISPRSILDPAYGLGVFREAVHSLSGDRPPAYSAYEIDAQIVSALGPVPGVRLAQEDYLTAGTEQYEGILCNPPYLHFQKFLTRHAVRARLENELGVQLAGFANAASVFLVKALHQLKPGGRLAFVMPSEFFDTNYGRVVRQRLLDEDQLRHMYLFANERELFPDAVTTVAVLLCERAPCAQDVQVHFVRGLEDLQIGASGPARPPRLIPRAQLAAADKWGPLVAGLIGTQEDSTDLVPFSRYGRFRRGIATGANRYLSLTRQQADMLHLEAHHLQACVTRSTQVSNAVFSEEHFQALDRGNKPVWFFSVQDTSEHPVRAYVARGEAEGVHQRYLTRQRKPWYKAEHRAPAPLWVSTFYRERVKAVRNLTNARTYTCFHSFYPAAGMEKYLDALFAYLHSETGNARVRLQRRQYGNGLEKFEPGDLNAALCPRPERLENLDARLLQCFLHAARENLPTARGLASDLFAPPGLSP